MITLGPAYNENFTHRNTFSTLMLIRTVIFRENKSAQHGQVLAVIEFVVLAPSLRSQDIFSRNIQ